MRLPSLEYVVWSPFILAFIVCRWTRNKWYGYCHPHCSGIDSISEGRTEGGAYKLGCRKCSRKLYC
jgi:hypothetical protein